MNRVNQLCLRDKYRLERKIAQGGMSSVYLCTNIELGNKWVAKHIDKKYSNFLYEEEILKKLNHISLPKIIDICNEDSGIYIIESYIEGTSLQKKLEILGQLTVDKVIEYALQLCEVLIYLHNIKPKPIIHKDLKPSNIIITSYERLVLIDFGISEELGGRRGGVKAGTNAYASPEQLAHPGASDTRGDIYSFGIVLHQMLTGQLPGGDNENLKANKASSIYNNLLDISRKCSRFYPDERYQSVEEIKKDLLRIRTKEILFKERTKNKRKVILKFIVVLSLVNYLCFIIGLLYAKR